MEAPCFHWEKEMRCHSRLGFRLRGRAQPAIETRSRCRCWKAKLTAMTPESATRCEPLKETGREPASWTPPRLQPQTPSRCGYTSRSCLKMVTWSRCGCACW